eukprot:9813548-Prorocentrum_lima.AAC.1
MVRTQAHVARVYTGRTGEGEHMAPAQIPDEAANYLGQTYRIIADDLIYDDLPILLSDVMY